MHYEHLIQINDPGNPMVEPMTREQLWRGIEWRVREPQRYELGPDRCEVVEQIALRGEGTQLARTVHFGALRIEDEVTLEPQRRVVFTPRPQPGLAAVRLAITIEEPAQDALFLRFAYDSPPEHDDPQTDEVRTQAWLGNDRDMVRQLRRWLREGTL